MTLRVLVDASGGLSIECGDVAIRSVAVALGDAAADGDSLRASPWESSVGSDAGGARNVFRQALLRGEQVALRQHVEAEDGVAWIGVSFEQAAVGLAVGDTFERTSIAVPRFSFSPRTTFLATTFGLGSSDANAPGGYWPAAVCGTGPASLPDEAFAPLVLFGKSGALAIAPASHFLTSPLLRCGDGVSRSLHGSVDVIPEGSCLETVVASGATVSEALLRLGDALLARGGKRRATSDVSLATSRLGWWNAYGGYYTEPIRPLNGGLLVQVIESLARQRLPVRYIGLDLWYPYREIGQALRFAPDPKKYADGLARIGRQFGVSFVLHLSALARDNAYGTRGGDGCFYADVAEEISRQGGCAVWHDWLRTQQHLTPDLRSDPALADAWFSSMGRAFGKRDLGLILCMQTMGMALASTQMPNAFAARSAIDYLFGQPEALQTLAALGHPGFAEDSIERRDLMQQNLLVGSVLFALGLLPFHDLFLSRSHSGLGGAEPRVEAALRALSCGPVGIGDGPGGTDLGLVASLLASDGRVLRPDHPPLPDTATLGLPIEIYRTECVAGSARWEYAWAMNRSPHPAEVDIPSPAYESHAWDVFARRPVETLHRRLAPGEAAYVLFAPSESGIAPIGLLDKLVPAPAGVLRHAESNGAWRIDVDAPGDWFSFASPHPIRVLDESGHALRTVERDGLVSAEVPAGSSCIVAVRR